MRGRRWCVGIALIPVLLLGAVGAKPLIAQRPAGQGVSPAARSAFVELVGTYDALGLAHDIVVSGSRAYILTDRGLEVADVSNPARPRRLGSCEMPAAAAAISGERLYIAGWNSGLWVVDVSNSARPRTLGRCETPGTAVDVAIAGRYAYVATGYAGLRVVDVSNPAAPREVGCSDAESGWIGGVRVSGRVVYLLVQETYWAGQLVVMDLSNPTTPRNLGRCETDCPMGVDISGGFAYAIGVYGLEIIDVRWPSSPRVLSRHGLEGMGADVCVSGNSAYVLHGGPVPVGDTGVKGLQSEGLSVLDVSDPMRPHALGFYDYDYDGGYDWPRKAVYVSGGLAYVADRKVMIFRYRPPRARAFLPLALKGR